MKPKKSLLILFMLLTTGSSFAGEEFRFGLKASPTLAWFKTDTKGLDPDGAKLTFSWGFMAEYFFAENYAFASGIEFSSYGGKLTTPNPSAIVNMDMRMNYIDVPLTIKMRTKEIGYMRYFGQFGITPGFNISSKADLESITTIGGVTTTITQEDEDIKSDIVPLNVSLLIALGLEYGLSGNTALVFSASFHNGFLDIADFSIPDPQNTATTKSAKLNTNAIRLNVGILF
jgi:hypothetical protein